MKNEKVIELKYDGGKIAFDTDMLTKHTLLVGSTGCGKTTTLNVMLKGLINFKASNQKEKMGLLIFDFKDDNTIAKVRKWAKECGRENDVIDYSLNSGYYFDPLRNLRSPYMINQYMEILWEISPMKSMVDNYWENAARKRLRGVLTTLFLLHDGKLTFEQFTAGINSFLGSGCKTWIDELKKRYNNLAESKADGVDRYKWLVKLCYEQLKEWHNLHPMTRGCEASVLSNISEAISAMDVADYLMATKDKKSLEVSDVLKDGKIVVFSISSTTNRTLATIIGKFLKSEFYTKVQERASDDSNERLVAIVMDEWQLSATKGEGISSDIVNMQTIRSKRGMVIAATQGFSGLEAILGESETMMALTNFNNVFLFRTNEGDRFGLFNIDETRFSFDTPIPNLATGMAYVKTADGFISDTALEIKRLYVKLTLREERKPPEFKLFPLPKSKTRPKADVLN